MVIGLNLVKLEKKEPHGEIGWLLFDVLLHLLVVKTAAELLRGFQYYWHLCVVVERRRSLVSWEAQQSWAGFACGCCRAVNATDLVHKYTTYLTRKQDELLDNFFKKSSSNSSSRPSYTKLYSYHHIVNGFAVELTAEEVSQFGVCLLHSFFGGSSWVFFLAFFRPSCDDKKVTMYAVKNKLAWVDEEQYCINKLQAWMGRWGAMYKILVLSSTRQSKPHLTFCGGFLWHDNCDGNLKADLLAKDPGVVQVQKSYRVQKATVHTPYYLQLPQGIWAQEGGYLGAGENIVIGLVDTGIDPTHPSFSTTGQKPYGPLTSYHGKCEVAPEFPLGSCNGKIIGAQHFAAAASKDGVFNATLYFASPLDGDGHGRYAWPLLPAVPQDTKRVPKAGKNLSPSLFSHVDSLQQADIWLCFVVSHTASTAAGNHGVPVIVNGAFYGNASGMAPRAR